MLATLPFVLVSLGFALVAAYYAGRLHHPSAGAAAAPSIAPSEPVQQPTLVRLGHIRAALSIGPPLRSTTRVAPPDRPERLLVVRGPDGATLVDVRPDEIVMARAWSGGKLLVAVGEARRDYGPSWPKGQQIAGWEVHLVTTQGEIVRCYGTPGVRLDADIDRFRSRLTHAVLAQAG